MAELEVIYNEELSSAIALAYQLNKKNGVFADDLLEKLYYYIGKTVVMCTSINETKE